MVLYVLDFVVLHPQILLSYKFGIYASFIFVAFVQVWKTFWLLEHRFLVIWIFYDLNWLVVWILLVSVFLYLIKWLYWVWFYTFGFCLNRFKKFLRSYSFSSRFWRFSDWFYWFCWLSGWSYWFCWFSSWFWRFSGWLCWCCWFCELF